MNRTDDRRGAASGAPVVTIRELTDALGCYVWLSRRLAAALGDWGTDEVEPPVAVYLHALARRCSDHGACWEALLADSPALEATESVRPPSVGWDEVFRAESAGTAERLVTLLHIVLPRLLVSLEEFAARLGPVAEAPEQRACAIVIDDLRALRDRGVLLVDEQVPAPQQRRLAAVMGRRLAGLSC